MQLEKYGQPGPTGELKALAAQQAHLNIFNVSLRLSGGVFHAAYRARIGSEKRFRAYYTVRDAGGSGAGAWRTPVDLTAIAALAGIAPVADPKLFEAHGAVYATFNTGYSADADNDIYVVKLSPEPGPLQRCVLEGGRNRVEKNWAFWEHGDGLAGLYGLSPLVGLEQVGGVLGEEGELRFARRSDAVGGDRLGAWSLGTQPLVGEGRLLLVAHEKIAIGPRRTYFGRLVELTVGENAVTGVRVSRRRLIHSIASMLPRRGVHNPNLLSATYFAGISRIDDDVILSYGINDVDFAIARTTEASLWH